jgi:hypothetical protein
LFPILDAVVSDSHREAANTKTLCKRLGEEKLSRAGSEEDDLCSCGFVALPVGLVNDRAPDASDVADLSKQFMMSNIRWEIGQPKGAVLLWGETQGACISGVMFSFVVVGEDRLARFIFAGRVAGRASNSSHGPEATGIFLTSSQSQLLTMVVLVLEERSLLQSVLEPGGENRRENRTLSLLDGSRWCPSRGESCWGSHALVLVDSELAEVTPEAFP